MRLWLAVLILIFSWLGVPRSFGAFGAFGIFGTSLLWAEQAQTETPLDPRLQHGLDTQKKNEPLAIYLLTIEPGKDLKMPWAWWGHTALLIRDQNRDLELVFDYGLFEDLGPSFLYHYLKGQPNFLLGISSLDKTLRRYQLQRRAVYAQRLYAKKQSLEALYQKLIINAQPQNRKYLYHHYYNNCTTIVRDLIDEFLFEGSLRKKYTQGKGKESIRKRAVAPGLAWPPIFIVFNSTVGYSLDRSRDHWRDMFLPVDLMQALERHRMDLMQDLEPHRKTAMIGPRRILWQSPELPSQSYSDPSGPSDPSENLISLLRPWLLFTLFFLLWLFIFYLYPLLYPKKKPSSFLGLLGWWLCFLPLSLTALLLGHIYFGNPSGSFGYETAGYNFSLHALNPLLFALLLAYPFCRKGKRAKLWFGLHRAFLLCLEIGCVLALFLALYALPLLLGTLCMQRIILIQVKRGNL